MPEKSVCLVIERCFNRGNYKQLLSALFSLIRTVLCKMLSVADKWVYRITFLLHLPSLLS